MDNNIDTTDILRIYICGPHSTGKTTLLKDLKPNLENIKVADEFARDIIRSHGWSRDDYHPDKHPKVFKELSVGTLKALVKFDEECTRNGEDFISDRGIDPIVYIGFYLKEKQHKDVLYECPRVKEWITRMKKSLIFLVYPHQECIKDDGVRFNSSLHELVRFHDSFERELKLNDITYIKLTELDRKTRVTKVLGGIKTFKKRSNL